MHYEAVYPEAQVFDVAALRQKTAIAEVGVFARDFTQSLLLNFIDCSFPTAMAMTLPSRANAPILVEDRVLEEAGLTVHRDWLWGADDAVLLMAEIT